MTEEGLQLSSISVTGGRSLVMGHWSRKTWSRWSMESARRPEEKGGGQRRNVIRADILLFTGHGQLVWEWTLALLHYVGCGSGD